MPTLADLQPVENTNETGNSGVVNIKDISPVVDTPNSIGSATVDQLQPVSAQAHVSQLEPVTNTPFPTAETKDKPAYADKAQLESSLKDVRATGNAAQALDTLNTAAQTGEQMKAYENAKKSALTRSLEDTGQGLKWLQQNVGKHISTAIIKAGQYEPDLKPSMGWGVPQLPSMDSPDYPKALEAMTVYKSPEQKAYEAAPLFKDIPRATAGEYLGRGFLEATGANQLQGQQELDAQNRVTPYKIPIPNGVQQAVGQLTGESIPDEASLAQIIHGAVSFAGDMPYFMLGGELAPIGEMATAGDIAKATSEMVTPAVKLAKVKGLQTAGAGIEGAVQGAVLSGKDNQNVYGGAAAGGVAGVILHSFMSKITRDAAAKGAILQSTNTARKAADTLGAVLAPQTWKQYVADMTAEEAHVYPQNSPTKYEPLSSQVKTSAGEFKAPEKAYSSRAELKESGDRGATYAVRSATLDKSGDVWEVRKTQNVNTGVTKTVYKTRLDTKEKILDFMKDGARDTTDREALAILADKAAQHEPGYLLFKHDAFPYNEKPASPTSENKTANAKGQVEQKPMLLTPDKKGDLRATPIEDGALDPTVYSPKRAKVGDMVRDHEGSVGEMVAERGPTAVIRGKDGSSSKATVHDLVPVDESTLGREDFITEGQKVTNRIGSFVSEKPKVKVSSEGVLFKEGRNIGEGTLLSRKKLTIPRVMKILNTDSAPEAAGMLSMLEKDGKVIHDGNGNYFVRDYKPEFPDLPDHGFKVYIGVGNEGQGRTGILRGRDPKNLNNYLIEVGKGATPVLRDAQGDLTSQRMGPNTLEQNTKAAQISTPALPIKGSDIFPKTKMLSVPAQKVRTWKPVLAGDANMSQLPMEMGVQVPLPSGIVTTNQNVAQQVGDMSRQVGRLSKLGAPLRAIKIGMAKLINHEAWLLPTELRSIATSLSAQPSLYKTLVQQYQDAIASRLGGIGSNLDSDLNGVIQRNAAKGVRTQELNALARKYPELVGEARTTIDVGLQMMKDNSEALAKYGIRSIDNLETLRTQGVIDEYTQNVYLKRLMMRDDFVKFVREQLPDRWRKVGELIASRHPEWGSQNIESRMLEILGAEEGDIAALRQKPTGDASKMLKKRIELAQEIKGLLGDVNSASVRMAHSMAATQSIRNTVELWNQIAKTNYWSPGPRIDLGPASGELIPNLPIYGNAAGGRLHSSMKFLLEQKDTSKEGLKMFNSLSALWKRNKVVLGGPAQWVNNAMRNWKGMVLSGGLSTPDDLATFFDAAQIMLKYHSNPVIEAGSSLYNEALQNGTVDAGFGATEVAKHRTANKIMAAVIKQKGKTTSAWDVMSAAGQAIEGGQDEITAAYDQIDKLYKFTAYLNLRRNKLAEGMSVNDAAAFAKIRVTQSFPMFSMVSPVIEKMRRGSISGIAPFLSGKAEDIRINATAIKRLASEPDLWARMIGAAGVVGGAYAFMREIRRANGITDADAYAATNSPKLSFQKFKPTLFVGPELDEQGRMQMYDMSSWEDLLQSMQSHPLDPTLASFVRNQMTGVFGDNNLPGMAIDMGASKLLNLHPLNSQMSPQYRPGENGIMTTLAFLAQNGMVPGFLERLNTIENKTHKSVNPITAAQNPVWTQSQAQAKFEGSPFSGPVGPELQTGRGMELGGNLKDMGKQMGQSVLNNIGNPDEQQRLIKAKQDAMQEFIRNYEQSQRKP